MEFEGKYYWTLEELIDALGSDEFNKLNEEGAFGYTQWIPDLYDGLVYAEEFFSKEALCALSMQTFSPD